MVAFGTFSFKLNKRYVYSERVLEAEKKVEKLKEEEKAKGTYDDVIIDTILMFKKPKEQNENL